MACLGLNSLLAYTITGLSSSSGTGLLIYMDTCCFNRPFDDLEQFESGYGDYTEEREEKLKDITLEDIVTSIRNRACS